MMTKRRALAFAMSLAVAAQIGVVQARAETAAPGDPASPSETAKPDAAKKPTKAELGEMLKKCSEEADAKGLTVQKGKSEARKAYRRSCMLKSGVASRKK